MQRLSLIFFLSAFTAINQAEISTYRAGVVEYHQTKVPQEEALEKNLQNYLDIIKNASSQQVDILVFPEATLNRGFGINPIKTAVVIPSPENKFVPCESKDIHNSRILDLISCAAKSEKMYIVINVAELENCSDTSKPNCEEKKSVLYNTNVVFDRNGTIISRYRKINLFGEPRFTKSQDQNLGIFDTDFGVRFGHFICFDILFQRPAVAVVEAEKIQNVIFPTLWFSELPSFTAVEIQQGWAYGHNVNFLVAGANNPKSGQTGSGIYSGKNGALISVMHGVPKTELLVADVPKVPKNTKKSPITSHIHNNNHKQHDEDMNSLHLWQANMTSYVSELIDFKASTSHYTLTHNNVTCQFNISLANEHSDLNSTTYYYRAIAFNGLKSFKVRDGGIVECGIVACTTEELSSCGQRFPDHSKTGQKYTISNIEIIASVPKPIYNDTFQTLDTAYYPVTVALNIMPLKCDEFNFIERSSVDSSKITLYMKLDEPHKDLLMFGFLGRLFHLDSDEFSNVLDENDEEYNDLF